MQRVHSIALHNSGTFEVLQFLLSRNRARGFRAASEDIAGLVVQKPVSTEASSLGFVIGRIDRGLNLRLLLRRVRSAGFRKTFH